MLTIDIAQKYCSCEFTNVSETLWYLESISVLLFKFFKTIVVIIYLSETLVLYPCSLTKL